MAESDMSWSTFMVPCLTPYFDRWAHVDERSFFRAYSKAFERIHASEVEFAQRAKVAEPAPPPEIGDAKSPLSHVSAFYSYWTSFTTTVDFSLLPKRKKKDVDAKARARRYSERVRHLARVVRERGERVTKGAKWDQRQELWWLGIRREMKAEKQRTAEREKRWAAEKEEREKILRARARMSPEEVQRDIAERAKRKEDEHRKELRRLLIGRRNQDMTLPSFVFSE